MLEPTNDLQGSRVDVRLPLVKMEVLAHHMNMTCSYPVAGHIQVSKFTHLGDRRDLPSRVCAPGVLDRSEVDLSHELEIVTLIR